MKNAHRLLIISLLSTLPALTACTKETDHSTPSSAVESTKISSADSAAERITVPEPDAPLNAEGMHFSVKSGFYENEFHLSISAAEGTEIYYTLDGSTPDASSTRYTEPILIADRTPEKNTLSAKTGIAQPLEAAEAFLPKSTVDKATVVRAIAINPNGAQSGVVSNTYFVGFGEKAKYYQSTKIISLITDPDRLFDYETGIYMAGKKYDDWKNGEEYDANTPDYFMPGNYTQKGREWEREATFQFFADGTLAAEQDLGIRIHGGATRSYPQKSLKIYARKDYGAEKLKYDLFSGNVKRQTDGAAITKYDSFVLRNGGNDAQYTRFSDKLIQSLVSDRQILTQGMEPCILFIDGEFWGQYELTEKVDNKFISAHTEIPSKDICLIKKEALEDGSEEGFAEWKQLRKWIQDTDFSKQEAYEQLCGFVDMQSFMDYVSTEIYINNWDWGKPNSAMWKAQTIDTSNPYADGKWRFILFDTEYSSGLYDRALASDDSFARLQKSDSFLADLFQGAMENAGFRTAFHDTFMEIASQNFSNERVSKEIDRLSGVYRDMAIDTYNRFWSGIIGGYAAEENYQDSVNSLRRFYERRYDEITAHLEKYINEPKS